MTSAGWRLDVSPQQLRQDFGCIHAKAGRGGDYLSFALPIVFFGAQQVQLSSAP
jgi:hypothetical protein